MKKILKRTDLLTRLSFLIFIVAVVIFGAYYFMIIGDLDKQGPEISMENERIEVSVKDSKETLLQGVKAIDTKDGDVTSSLMIENISNFTNEQERIITYAAVDKSNNVTTAKRTLEYTDYVPPEFRLSAPMKFTSTTANLLPYLSAVDCLDGDITSSIKITGAGGFKSGVAGTYYITFQAANSAGDVAELTTAVTLYNAYDYRATAIELTDYIVYLDRGADFDAQRYLKDVIINGVTYELEEGLGTYGDPLVDIDEQTIGYDRILVDEDVDIFAPGTYDVLYSLTMTTISGDQIYGEVHMPVIVRDN